jgi:hypothetical protein
MTDLGPLHYFLEIEILSTSNGFYISQDKYIQDLLARAALGDERTVETPMVRRSIAILLGALSILLSLDSTYPIRFIF